jgi:hypothetical protein
VEEKEEKHKVLQKYKEAMSNKTWGYLNKGHGRKFHLEETVFISMHTLMAIRRSHSDRKWEHQGDYGPNEGTTSGSSLRKERMATPLTMTKRRLSPLSWARCFFGCR